MPDLQPGRELDARVAQVIMGSRIRLSASSLLNGRIWLAAREFPAGETKEREVPQYSTDIGAAWLIVAAMRLKGYHFLTMVSADTGLAIASFYLGPHDRTDYSATEGDVSEAPLAICRAALKRLAVEQPA